MVNPYIVATYTTGTLNWVQVSFSRKRKMRRFEWYLSSVPGSGNVLAPSGTGNSDCMVSADAIHPSVEGHGHLAVPVAGSITAPCQRRAP